MTQSKNIIRTLLPLALVVLGVSSQAAAQSQAWFKQFPNGKSRFKILKQFEKQAAVDKETGLVWQLAPRTTQYRWDSANIVCRAARIGNRFGWRLPTVEELASLVDSSQANPALPPNHPFSNFQNALYWTSSTYTLNPDSTAVSQYAYVVWFNSSGGVTGIRKSTTSNIYTLCVRGGSGPDGGVNQN